jgi:hypothetical protein
MLSGTSDLGRNNAVAVYQLQIHEKESHAQVSHALLDGKSEELIKALDSRERKKTAAK